MIVTKFTLIPFDPSFATVWDAVVAASKNGNFLHYRNDLDYHAHRFEEHSVIVQKNGGAVAVFPCNLVEGQVVSHGGLTYAGLIYNNDLRALDALNVFKLLGEHYQAKGCESVIYKAVPHVFHRYPAEEDLYALHRIGARIVRRDLSTVVQLPNRIKLSDSRKSTVKKAIKNGAVVREGDFFEEFYSLLVAVLAQHDSIPVHTLSELKLLKSRFPDKIRLFGVFVQDKLLAGGVVYDFDRVAHSQYLASSDEGKLIGALDLLLASLLDHAFSKHLFFSFGISTEEQGRHLNEGLVFQKEGFGGRAMVHDFYEWKL